MGGLSQKMGGAWGQLKMSKNTCEGVQLIVKLPAISLQASKFTKNQLHTYFSRTLTRFIVLFLGIISWKGVSCFNWGASFLSEGVPHGGHQFW